MYIQALSHRVRNSDLMNYNQMKTMHEDSENVVQEFTKVSTFKLFYLFKNSNEVYKYFKDNGYSY